MRSKAAVHKTWMDEIGVHCNAQPCHKVYNDGADFFCKVILTKIDLIYNIHSHCHKVDKDTLLDKTAGPGAGFSCKVILTETDLYNLHGYCHNVDNNALLGATVGPGDGFSHEVILTEINLLYNVHGCEIVVINICTMMQT